MWFVSHYWGSAFRDFVHTLKRHAQEVCQNAEITYWICSFSNNQWRIKEELGKTVTDSPFYKGLRSNLCRGTVLVLDDRASPLRRSWCLFEMLQTMLLVDDRKDGSYSGLWPCTDSGSLRSGDASVELAMTIADVIAELRVEDAEASQETDKDMINDAIREHFGDDGFKHMDAYLRKNLIEALGTMRDKTEQQFSYALEKLKDLRGDATVRFAVSAKARFAASRWLQTMRENRHGRIIYNS